MIEAVGSEMVGLFFDTDHLYQTPDLFENIERAGPAIYGVHINDMPKKPRASIDRRMLGEGEIPLKEIIAAIDATGYTGFYDVEIMSDKIWKMEYDKLLDELKTRFNQLTQTN